MSAPPPLRARGIHVEPTFASPARCQALLADVARTRAAREAPLVERRLPGRSLRYRVLDGTMVRAVLPAVWALAEECRPLAETWWGRPLVVWPDERVAVNVNITPPGGEYRWHYDRNPVTLLVYLNAVAGGEIDCYPRYRLYVGRHLPTLQAWLDRLLLTPAIRDAFGERLVVAPHAGLLLAMAGRTCLHSVRAVRGDRERVSIVLAYGDAGARRTDNAGLDRYLYTGQPTPGRDPNYAA